MPYAKPFACCLVLVLAGSGCKTMHKSVSAGDADRVGFSWDLDRSKDEGSMFPSDQAVLSNDDIARILSARVALPARARLAVMKFGGGTRYWSESSPILGQQATTTFLDALQQSPRIAAASALPGILVPERRTVPYLREAAARYQADLLLVFRQDAGSYEKYRFTHSDQVKAYCTVEAALLDVRSGTVPFTTVSFQEVNAEKSKEDLNFDETTDKAYHAAEARALQEIATAVVQFLSTASAPAVP